MYNAKTITMSATPGNKWWELRATHGREKTFSSPDHLWQSAVEYFKATDKRKWVKKDWVGKDAVEVERETDTPYTISGLCIFLDIDTDTFLNYGKEAEYKDFFGVVRMIREIIYTQKFEGAATGAYNANIIARDLGLRDAKDVNNTGELTLKQITGMEVK